MNARVSKRFVLQACQFLPLLISLGLLAWVLRSADRARGLELARSLGPWLALIVVPNAFAILADATGWWLSFDRLGGRPRFAGLLGVRVIGDALLLGLPTGALISETVQPWLLKQRCGVPTEQGIVAVVARKFFVVLSHGIFLGLATLAAWPLLDGASRSAIGRLGLPVLLLATAAALVTVALLIVAATAAGHLAESLRRALDRVLGRWVGSRLEHSGPRFRRIDDALALFFRRPLGLAPSLLLYMVGWMARSLETLLILRLVGVQAPLVAAMVIESALILLRAVAVPVPAGLGVQDLGYVLCLEALGVADPATVGVTFVLLKRGKDAFWVATGFLLVGLARRRRALLTEPAG